MWDDSLSWMPGWKLRDLIVQRKVSPVEVTKHFLDRIESLDPTLAIVLIVDVSGSTDLAFTEL